MRTHLLAPEETTFTSVLEEPDLILPSEAPFRRVVWTIAGFDPSSGAGITADLTTFAAHGLFGCSAITAYTVQSTVQVFAVEPIAPTLLDRTLSALSDDLPPEGIKIGMLASAENATVVAERLRVLRERGRVPVVLDPVLRSSSGRELFPSAAIEGLRRDLLPHVDWITPNWMELAALCGVSVRSPAEAAAAATELSAGFAGLNVVVTGGDQANATDLLVHPGGDGQLFRGEHVETSSTHGTGCAFSSALLCAVVRGAGPVEAVGAAKAFVTGALRRAPGLGQGRGPIGLLWPLLER